MSKRKKYQKSLFNTKIEVAIRQIVPKLLFFYGSFSSKYLINHMNSSDK